jgi:RNA chaperone Hfq
VTSPHAGFLLRSTDVHIAVGRIQAVTGRHFESSLDPLAETTCQDIEPGTCQMKHEYTAGQPSAQDRFLSELITAHTKVDVFLTNGIRLHGEIIGFDNFVIQLNGPSVSQVYKRAVSTIQLLSAPSRVSYRGTDDRTATIMKQSDQSLADKLLTGTLLKTENVRH